MVGRLLEDRGDRRCRHFLAADGVVVGRLEEEPRTGEETGKRQQAEYFGRPMNAAPRKSAIGHKRTFDREGDYQASRMGHGPQVSR